jgi:FG-GAP repeat
MRVARIPQFLILLSIFPVALSAQITQLAELMPSDPAANQYFGGSVAASGDTLVVGSYAGCGTTAGEVYVFVRPRSGWSNMTQTAKLTASNGQPGDCFGADVAISGDTILVGADNTTIRGVASVGTVYVFVKQAGGWANMTETAQLHAANGGQSSYFGGSIAIQGGTAVVGAYSGGENQHGASFVFVEPSGGWKNMTETAELAASNPTPRADFGESVAIDGNTIVVGAGCAPTVKHFHIFCGPGIVYVFVEPAGGWVNATETAMLTSSEGQYGAGLGTSVAISGDTIAAGASFASPASGFPKSGEVYVFTEPSEGWTSMTQTAELSWDLWELGRFGQTVAIQDNAILAGAPDDPVHGIFVQGIVSLFLEPADGWINATVGNLALTSSGATGFGNSIAINGENIAIGAPYSITNLQNAGTAYVFGREP